jgi:hypothetical protein
VGQPPLSPQRAVLTVGDGSTRVVAASGNGDFTLKALTEP